jgi:cysteine desulfurase
MEINVKRIYMDYAATTPVDSRVVESMKHYWQDKFGNPSSTHGFGQESLEAVEKARRLVAVLMQADSSEIVFTSGGTEADNMAIQGVCRALYHRGNHVITSSIEHHAVLRCCDFMSTQGFEVTCVPVDQDGIIDPSKIKKHIQKETILISIMHANNEIGTIQPISEIGRIAHEHGILFHTDAVQSYGHIPIDVNTMEVDLLSISAHKLYGPKGVGALYIRKNTPVVSLIYGGDQEHGRRSSTHNVPGIVGLGKAAEIASGDMNHEMKKITALRNQLFSLIEKDIDGIRLNGHPEKRLPNNLNLSIDHVEGEALLMNLDLEGVAVSSGSACSAGSGEPSHVLMALGLSKTQAGGSLRITLGRYTKEEEIKRVAAILVKVVKKLRALSPFGEEGS